MLSETMLEQRLVNLEQAVSDIQQKISTESSQPAPKNWLENLIGSVSDEAAFLESLEYGRAFRQDDRPVDEATEQLRNICLILTT